MLLGVFFLAGCSLQPVSQTPSTTSTAMSQQPEQQIATTTPPTTETANWKTYTDDKYGFEIRHPNNYKEELVRDNDKETYLRLYLNGSANSGEIEVLANPATDTEENFSSKSAFLKWRASGEHISGNEIKDVSLESLNGYNILKTHEVDGITAIGEYIYFHKQNRVIFFATSFLGEKSDLEMFHKIVSTFKFTK